MVTNNISNTPISEVKEITGTMLILRCMVLDLEKIWLFHDHGIVDTL